MVNTSKNNSDKAVDGSLTFSLAELEEIELTIAKAINMYLVSNDKLMWLEKYFHADYPKDASNEEIFSDIISKEINKRV